MARLRWIPLGDEPRRIACRARQLGYVAVTLGNATEAQWAALRVALGAEAASALTLADAVDVLACWERNPEEL